MKKTQSYFNKRKICGACHGTGFSSYKHNSVCVGCNGQGKYKKLVYKTGVANAKNVVNKFS